MFLLCTIKEMGVPSVNPRSVPDKMVTWSASLRDVVTRLCPGRRRVSCGWMSASDSGMHAGQPSITAPTAAPCDSPYVETRKYRPYVLIAPAPGPAGWRLI